MADTDPSRELLFGVLAMRAGLIDGEQFAATCRHWSSRREKSFFDCWAERGELKEADRTAIVYLVERALARHGGDATAALRDTADVSVWRSLAQLRDPDLRRWLEGVLPGANWLQREPTSGKRGLALVGLFLLLLVGIAGLGGIFIFFMSRFGVREAREYEMVARMEAEQARAAAVQAEMMARQRADANFQAAREAVDNFLLKVEELEEKPLDAARRKLLEQALRQQEAILNGMKEEPATREEMAKASRRLALIQEQLGQVNQALKESKKALSLLEKQGAESPPGATGPRTQLGAVHQQLARLYRKADQQREAEEAGRQAIALFTKLAAESPELPEARDGLIDSLLEQGELMRSQGRPAEAEQALRQAIDLLQKLANDFPKQAGVSTRLEAARKKLEEVKTPGKKE